MANRSRLHISKLEDFKEWLVKDGWEIEEPKGVWEVLRARRAGRKNPLIIYTKADVKEHLSVMDRDSGVIGAYLKDCKKTKTNADSKTTEWMAQKWLEQFEFPTDENSDDALAVICEALQEYPKFRAIGTVEEWQSAIKEEDVLKFYYIESEDRYVVGRRVGNFYYGEVGKTGLCFNMSRYLPWGEHIVAPDTLWKEHTYPSEPKEIPFYDWLQGFIKKECGGTIEELQALKEKSVAKKVTEKNDTEYHVDFICPNCNEAVYRQPYKPNYCKHCGQHFDWE